MALDSLQKRMSSVLVLMPFRGPMVDPTESGFGVGNRMAAIWSYASNFAAAGAAVVRRGLGPLIGLRRNFLVRGD